jgi:hypothetical protein
MVTPAPSISTPTATLTSATCHDPGWLGCRDPVHEPTPTHE